MSSKNWKADSKVLLCCISLICFFRLFFVLVCTAENLHRFHRNIRRDSSHRWPVICYLEEHIWQSHYLKKKFNLALLKSQLVTRLTTEQITQYSFCIRHFQNFFHTVTAEREQTLHHLLTRICQPGKKVTARSDIHFTSRLGKHIGSAF